MSGEQRNIHQNLIERCRKDDVKAQYRLYKLYSKAMYNVCIRMVTQKEDAEDLLQDAFVTAFRNLDKFRMEASFGTWMRKIVINKCINQLQKKKLLLADLKTIANYSEYDEINEEDQLNLDAETVHYAIKELPEGARVVFNLFSLEGYKHKEIAVMLKISESTSKSQYQRARILLQQKLKKEPNENRLRKIY